MDFSLTRAGVSWGRRRALGEHRFDRVLGATQLGKRAIDVGALAGQSLDTLFKTRQRDAQLRLLAVTQIVQIEHFPDFFEREPDALAHQDVSQSGAIATA